MAVVLLRVSVGMLATIHCTLSTTVEEATTTPECTDEQCKQTASSNQWSNLLQIASHTNTGAAHETDHFGPGRCVGLKRSVAGSCVLRTRCKGHNISQTEFAFVCFDPGATMPHALHSFGRGGFALQESFDTKVHCKSCLSVDTAFRTGDSIVKNALAALPLGHLPSLNGAVKASASYSASELEQFKPKEAASFGPDFCISTFRAPAGTCLIRTRCAESDLSTFNVGVTCLDKSGGYTRYLFGKDTFKSEETFDTLISCDKCLGVAPESSVFALHGLMPRKLVDDVSTLKSDVATLHEKVRVLQEAGMPTRPKSHLASEEASDSTPTIMMSRRPVEASRFVAAEAPLAEHLPAALVAQDSGAETAAINLGEVQLVSHRRPGAAIAELLKRITK